MKKIQLLLIILSCVFFAKAQTVTGRITNGNRPDAGAKIYLMKYDETATPLVETMNNFLEAKKYRVLYADSMDVYSANKKLSDGYAGKKRFADEYAASSAMADKEKAAVNGYLAKLQALNAATKPQFDSLDNAASTALAKSKYYPGNLTASADDNGSYSLKADPGNCAVLIISEARTGISSTEIYGKIFVQHFNLAAGETKHIDVKFVAD